MHWAATVHSGPGAGASSSRAGAGARAALGLAAGQGRRDRSRARGPSAAIRVSSRPSVGEEITSSSPAASQTRGSRTLPTPSGVPVETMSPGSSVISPERWESSSGTLKISSAVEAPCICSPFSVSEISIASAGPASSGVTSAGPQGAEPSKTLPDIHCGVANCRSRAERSLSRV